MKTDMIRQTATPLSAVAFAVMLAACGGGGGGSSSTSSVPASTDSSSSEIVSSSLSSVAESSDDSSSVFSSDFSSSSESGSTASESSDMNSSSESNSSSSAPSVRRVRVSDAYILEANVTIGGMLADIRLEDGQYEWIEMPTGILRSVGGANDLAEPVGVATEDDPGAFPMSAPEGYTHINPFTSMLERGGYDPEDAYPVAAAHPGENGLPFNYDVVAAGNAAAGGDLNIAKEVAKAALTLASIDPVSSSSSSSAASSSTASVSSTASSTVSSSSSSSSSTSTTPGSQYPAAPRSSLIDIFVEIDACGDNDCINAIVLREMLRLRGQYVAECELLPGSEACTDDGAPQSSAGSSSSAAPVSSSSSSVAASSSSAASGTGEDPFPE